MKRTEWMVALGAVASFAGATYSAGCANTAGDCKLLGTCGSGGGTGSSTATATATASSSATTGSGGGTSTSSTGTGGGAPALQVCDGHRYGDGADQSARAVRLDAAGDIFLAGDFQGTLNLGNGVAGTAAPASSELFVTELGPDWQAKWLVHFPVSYGAIAVGSSGSVILAGAYAGTPTFGCATPLDAANDLYVVKLKDTGECAWATSFLAEGAHVSLAVDTDGTIALAGDYSGKAVFDKTTLADSQGRDIFAAKLDASGAVLSADRYATPNNADELVGAVAFDGAHNRLITGTYTDDLLDFNNGKNALLHDAGAGPETYVAQLDVNAWATRIPGTGDQHATGLAVAGSRVVVAGDFTKSLTYDAKKPLTSKDTAFFVAALDTKGTVAWGKKFDGAGPKTIRDLGGDSTHLALIGSVAGDVDFAPGTPKGSVVMAELAAEGGATIWSGGFGSGAPAAGGNSVALGESSLFVAGGFTGALALDSMTTLQSTGGSDLFAVQICPP